MLKAPKDTALLKQARERFKLANDADSPQAQRERDDIAFEDGEQWPADIKLARQGQQPTNGLPAVPARPTLVINKVREPVRQILNQERGSDIGVELVPADDFGDLGITPDDTEVTLREGLIRRIQRESMAADARTWAFKRAVIAGRGYYLVMTRYLPGKTNDQEIYVHRIYNQAAVLLDPAHEQPDGSDADYGFIGTWVPWDRFSAEYPSLADGKKNPFAEYSESDFMTLTETYPDWYRADGAQKAVRVVDYWYTERTARTLATLPDGSAVWEDEIPDGVDPIDTRTVVERQIKYCKIGGGVQELEKTDWAGPDMPIIKVLGEEILPYDEQRRAEGVVRPSRDSQMGENYMISKMVEIIGLTPIPPLMTDPDAIDGYEAFYNVANTRTLPYLPYRSRDDQGNELRPPMRPPVDPNILPIAQSIQMFDGFIQNTTGGSAPDRLGVGQRVQADRAIRRLQEEEQFNTSNYLDNLARSVRYEGQVENNLLYPIYGAKPGRLVRILTGEGEAETMQIGDPAQQQAQAAQRQKAQKVAKLTKDAHFNVIVKVAKSIDSRRSQETSTLGELISAEPQMMTWFGDLYFKNSDIPGRQSLAERAKVMLAPPIQQMLAQQAQGEPVPPAAQAKIAQLEQQVQHAEQAMQELADEAKGKKLEYQAKIDVEQIKQAADVERTRLETERDLAIQRMKDATALAVAHLNAETQGIVSAHTAVDEALALDQQHAHEAEQAALDRAQQQALTASQQAHQAATTEGQQDFTAAQADAQRQADQQAQTQERM